jgi:hypothetical protein
MSTPPSINMLNLTHMLEDRSTMYDIKLGLKSVWKTGRQVVGFKAKPYSSESSSSHVTEHIPKV